VEALYVLYVVKCMTVETLKVHRSMDKLKDECESESSKKVTSARIFKQFMGARNRVGIGLSYRTARLHSLSELVPWNRFLGSLNV
jgi:hypothetical protein